MRVIILKVFVGQSIFLEPLNLSNFTEQLNLCLKLLDRFIGKIASFGLSGRIFSCTKHFTSLFACYKFFVFLKIISDL
jgi:hypothetical protein